MKMNPIKKSKLVVVSAALALSALMLPARASVTNFIVEDGVLVGYSGDEPTGDLTISEGITGIGDEVFSGCSGITSLKLPSTLKSIGNFAFSDCADLRTVTGGASLEWVGCYAFAETRLVCGDKYFDGFSSEAEEEAYWNGLEIIYVGDFAVGCRGGLVCAWDDENEEYWDSAGNLLWRYNLKFRAGTVGIADELLGDGQLVTSIEMPDSLKYIGAFAFSGNPYLQQVKFGQGLVSIGGGAFANSGSYWTGKYNPGYSEEDPPVAPPRNAADCVVAVDLPDTVQRIGESAFEEFGYLYYVSGLRNDQRLGDDIFLGTPYAEVCAANGGDYQLEVEDGVLTGFRYHSDFKLDDPWIENGVLTIAEGVVEIGESVFDSMTGLTKVVFPSTLEKIGHFAFAMCENLEEVQGMGDAVSFPDDAFEGTLLAESWKVQYQAQSGGYTWYYVLKFGKAEIVRLDENGEPTFERAVDPAPVNELVIPARLDGYPVTSLGYGAFAGCEDMFQVVLPGTLQRIGEEAFSDCASIYYMQIPKSVTMIAGNAFMGCAILSSFYVDEYNPVFCSYYDALYTRDMKTLVAWPPRKDLELPTWVEHIGEYACYGNDTLAWGELYIPDTVRTIGASAFEACYLRRVELGCRVESIGSWAFAINSMASVIVPASVQRIEAGAFAYCHELAAVCFEGDAPWCGGPLYDNSENVENFIRTGTQGWNVAAGTWPLPDYEVEEDSWAYQWWYGSARPVKAWTTYPHAQVYWEVTFNLGRYGRRIGGGELTQQILDGTAAVLPQIELLDGVWLYGWSREYNQVDRDLVVTAIYVDSNGKQLPSYYVDGENGDDENDGCTGATAFATIQKALDTVVDGELIEVGDGVYDPIEFYDTTRNIELRSANGAESTSINGFHTSRCADFDGNDNVVLRGFTLEDGYCGWGYGGGVNGGRLINCVIRDCQVDDEDADPIMTDIYGGGAYASTLTNCLLLDNEVRSLDLSRRAWGAGAFWCYLYNCTVVGNVTEGPINNGHGSGIYNSWSFNSIMHDNAAEFETGWCISDGNVNPGASGNNWFGERNSGQTPRFREPGVDFRLLPGSPCVNAGDNRYVIAEFKDFDGNARIQDGTVDLGAFEGAAYTKLPGTVEDVQAIRNRVTWSEPSQAGTYRVYRATADDFTAAQPIGETAELVFFDENAVEGSVYYYWVRAVNPLGDGAVSDSAATTWPASLAITSSATITCTEGEGLEFNLAATGGVEPYEWSFADSRYVTTREPSTFRKVGTALTVGGFGASVIELPFAFPLGDRVADLALVWDGWVDFASSEEYLATGGDTFCSACATVCYDIIDAYAEVAADHVTFRWHKSESGGDWSITIYPDGTMRMSWGEGTLPEPYVYLDGRYVEFGGCLLSEEDFAADPIDISDLVVGELHARPYWLNLDSNDGVLYGVPVMGNVAFDIEVVDDFGEKATQTIRLSAAKGPFTLDIEDGVLYGFHGNGGVCPAHVDIPEGVVEIAEGAFAGEFRLDLSQLESISLPSTLIAVGRYAFWACRALKSIHFPENVEYVGSYAFYRCTALKRVTFASQVIEFVSEALFPGEWVDDEHGGERFVPDPEFSISYVGAGDVVHVGWWSYIDEYSAEAYELDSLEVFMFSGAYVAPKFEPMVIPDPDAAFWQRYPDLLAAADGDAEAAKMLPSPGKDGKGKLKPNGEPVFVWEDYVAGTNPKSDEQLRTLIEMVDGDPVITWEPALNGKGVKTGVRTYQVLGAQRLDGSWYPVPDGAESEYNYFKVRVSMP